MKFESFKNKKYRAGMLFKQKYEHQNGVHLDNTLKNFLDLEDFVLLLESIKGTNDFSQYCDATANILTRKGVFRIRVHMIHERLKRVA